MRKRNCKLKLKWVCAYNLGECVRVGKCIYTQYLQLGRLDRLPLVHPGDGGLVRIISTLCYYVFGLGMAASSSFSLCLFPPGVAGECGVMFSSGAWELVVVSTNETEALRVVLFCVFCEIVVLFRGAVAA